MSSLIPSEFILVTIKTFEKTIFQNKVKAVSAYNDKGIFDVLAQHANFISLIKDFIILHQQNGAEEKIPIKTGILKVYANEVNIYL